MTRSRSTLRLHRVTVRDLSHVIGGVPAFGQNDKVLKREETEKCKDNGKDK